MSWLIVATAVVGAYSAQTQYIAGKQQQIEIEQQADEEKLSAEAQELERRQKLNKALSANIVGVSTGGTTGEGTPASIALENAKQASISEGLEGLSSRLKQSQLKRQGDNAYSQGKMAAASTLLQTGARAKSLMKG